MPKSGPDNLSERLLAVDAPVSDEAYREYRMQLEQKLDRAVVMERRARLTMITLWVLTFLNLAFVAFLMNVLRIHSEWYGAFHAVLVIATLVETLFYFSRYRLNLARLKDERQIAFLRELSERVSDLSRRLDERQDSARS